MKSKGFTLIEILIVVAIISILTGVTLAALGSARGKGDDTSIVSTLGNARTQAELYYSNNGNYGIGTASPGGSYSLCNSGSGTHIFNTSPSGLLNALKSVARTNGATLGTDMIVCAASSNDSSVFSSWAIMASTSKSNWCVDSTGQSKEEVPGVGGISNAKCI